MFKNTETMQLQEVDILDESQLLKQCFVTIQVVSKKPKKEG